MINLEDYGFVRKTEWDYKVSKKRTRKVYVKNFGLFYVKAFLLHNYISFGKIINIDKPLCSIHSHVYNIDELNKTVKSWT